jgi:hypothetical protein
MKLFVVIVCVAIFSGSLFGQDNQALPPQPNQKAAPATWKSVAYLEFRSRNGDLKALFDGLQETTTIQNTESTEKVRTETSTKKDPQTGKIITETETTRSGQAKTSTLRPDSTSLLAIEKRQTDPMDKKSVQYRMTIDGQNFFELTQKEIKKASKIAEDYLRASKIVARGADVNPFVGLMFGDKERGAAIYHEVKRKKIGLRLWIKGRSFDVETTDGAAGFIADLAQL